MLRLLRWGTFLVLILVVLSVAFSYPILRQRLFTPMLAPQASAVEIAGGAAAATIEVTARPTMPPTRTAVPSSLIIVEPSPTPLSQTAIGATETPATSLVSPTPFAIATTSLLPPSLPPRSVESELAPAVVAPSVGVTMTGSNTTLPSAGPTVVVTPTVAVPPMVTSDVILVSPFPTATSTPDLASGEQPAPGEKGWLPPVEAPAGPSVASAVLVTPAEVTPVVVTTVAVTPSLEGAVDVTPIVAITVTLTPGPQTPAIMLLHIAPTANTDSPLYGGPDFSFAIVGQVTVGEDLTIIGWYTEGTWYLLANGMWLPGAVVDNAPVQLPLVFPTSTPIPTNTPTITPTPTPTATLVGSPTPTPTPTSLDSAVCDCSADTYDCLGNIFANRAEAQLCFEYCFRQTGLDIHILDPNLNGMACENLP